MKDKPPGPLSCPHCGNDNAERLPSVGDYSDYRCPACGDYRIDGSQEHRFDEGLADPREAWLIEDATERQRLLDLDAVWRRLTQGKSLGPTVVGMIVKDDDLEQDMMLSRGGGRSRGYNRISAGIGKWAPWRRTQ